MEENQECERGVQASPGDGTSKTVLILYVAGANPRSIEAILNLKGFCAEYLAGGCDVQVVDIYQQPQFAKGVNLLALPTLVKTLPAPILRVIGDLTSHERVLVGLEIRR